MDACSPVNGAVCVTVASRPSAQVGRGIRIGSGTGVVSATTVVVELVSGTTTVMLSSRSANVGSSDVSSASSAGAASVESVASGPDAERSAAGIEVVVVVSAAEVATSSPLPCTSPRTASTTMTARNSAITPAWIIGTLS